MQYILEEFEYNNLVDKTKYDNLTKVFEFVMNSIVPDCLIEKHCLIEKQPSLYCDDCPRYKLYQSWNKNSTRGFKDSKLFCSKSWKLSK